MASKIRIGTRESPLAQWQARQVQNLLLQSGHQSILVPVAASGDQDLVTPLYAMGVQGVFTRHLDAHLLQGDVDIAVHSMKDVPVQLAEGLIAGAVLPREDTSDLLILKKDRWHNENGHWIYTGNNSNAKVIATGSVRRKAQWLAHYPESRLENLRGNVQTRLRKLEENDWDGAVFAAAGLKRMNLIPEASQKLQWMLPAPAQGAILVVCREADRPMREVLSEINDVSAARCVKEERAFLKGLLGGCSTPIGALATMENDKMFFNGNICSPDGKECLEVTLELPLLESEGIGEKAAADVLSRGASHIIEEIRKFEAQNIKY